MAAGVWGDAAAAMADEQSLISAVFVRLPSETGRVTSGSHRRWGKEDVVVAALSSEAWLFAGKSREEGERGDGVGDGKRARSRRTLESTRSFVPHS